MGKQVRSSFKPVNQVFTNQALQLLHMDLFGPTKTQNIGGKKYCLVIVDDYSRFTWVYFMASKSEAFSYFSKFSKKVQKEKGYAISTIRTDYGGEFENQDFVKFCDEFGFQHIFSSPYTQEQNGVMERKNKSLQEMARTLLIESKISSQFWAEAVSTACYIINRVFLRPILEKTTLMSLAVNVLS